ncbi:helix-turn-helix domain-containing protein [Desulfosporosinus youngiae]|uniref:Putative transcriptional regulator n=1 Tax=Desulfosporosinus youngiae DSM 17734 TaxID=768710 RepID=H5Y693_9FIRM|nr:helix-turn-helix transcriptional regulator [Desulfosporosinus youngiae]EHQ91103.1 putative transcriptional regulator [Desulfosporosinus youngiae DSM 17734]
MSISNRIQTLRKIKGLSQEELADKIGVSRQAVSKWESNQSTPDIDKIIMISDYFEVTIDYLLKGIEHPKEAVKKKPDARIFSIVGTALNFIGLIAAIMVWHEEQAASSVAIGLIFMAIGCMSFALGQTVGADETKSKAKKHYWPINLWVLVLIPLSVSFNVLDGFFGGFSGSIAPYPLLGNSFITYGLCWLTYLGICTLGTIKMRKVFA